MSNTVRVGISAVDDGFKQTLSSMAQSSKAFGSSLDTTGKKASTFNGQLRAARKQAFELANAYRQLDDTARNSDFGQSLKAQLDAALQTAGELTDLKSDIKQEISNIASDTASWDAMSQGIGVVSSSLQGLASVVGLAGGNCEEFQRALVAVNAIQSVANTIIGIGNALQYQSALMVGLRNLRTKLFTTTLAANTTAQTVNTAATDAATASQVALNTAVSANPYVIAAVAVAALCAGIYLLVDANNDLTQSEKEHREAMSAVAEQMGEQSKTAAEHIGAYRILQSEYKKADGNLAKMKSTMYNFDDVCKEANITLKDQATAEKVLGSLSGVMIQKYLAEAEAAAISAAIQGKYAKVLAKIADIKKRISEGKTIDVGDLQELNIDVNLKNLKKLGLAYEAGFDDFIAHIFQPSAEDLKLVEGTGDTLAEKLTTAAFKGIQKEIGYMTKALSAAYDKINNSMKQIKDAGVDTNTLFNDKEVKKATNEASKHIRSTSKEINTLLSTLEGCDNVIRKAETDLTKLDHKSKNFASSFIALNATILEAKRSKLKLIDKSTLQGMYDAKKLAEDILSYIEPNTDEWNKQNDVISDLNDNIYEYLKKLAANGNIDALKKVRSAVENIIATLPAFSDKLGEWIEVWRGLNTQIDETERKIQNMKLGIQPGSATDLKQQLDAAIKELDNYKSNTKINYITDQEGYNKYLDNVDKMEKKIRTLAEQYSNQKIMANGIKADELKPIDLTFSYKQSDIEKINEQIRYYSEKEKILKKYDVELDDGNTFNILQDDIDETTKKIDGLKKQLKLTEINNDIKEYSKSIKTLGYDSIKNGVQGLEQMYENVSGLVEKLDDCKDPIEAIFSVFDTIFNAVDTVKSYVDGITELIDTIHKFTEAKEALNAVNATSTAISAGETIASQAAGDAAVTTAAQQTAAASTTAAAATGNKLLEKSLLDLAAAQIFAAHASIPVVGTGIAAGMVGAMMAAMAAQHAASTVLQSFAEGGIVKGSTTMGDNVLIRANAGEMLLNSKQQANLFNLLNSGAVNSSNVELSVSTIKIKGSDLYIALSNHKKITHKTL